MNSNRKLSSQFVSSYSQLLVPIAAMLFLIVFNLIRDVEFFSISVNVNSDGYKVLTGNLISILNGASELAILAMGMTLVTSACGGQDISVGATAAIAGSVFVRALSGGEITGGMVALAFGECILAAMLFGAFNGTLVAVFKIQPMIATLILFTCGRSVAYWINGGATPRAESPIVKAIGGFIPHVPVPTPIFIVALCGLLFFLLLKFTSLRLITQAVGVNPRAARLNGINTVGVKLLTFVILGACTAVAGVIGVGRLCLINHETLLIEIEMDTILAVAIGGNALSGGRFRLIGSVLGAYVIQALTTTLYAMKVSSTAIKAYKAVVIIMLVIISSPVIKRELSKLYSKLTSAKRVSVAGKE